MKVYKTLPCGTDIVEYEDSLAPAIADMWNQSGDSWGGDSSERTAAQIIMQHKGSSNLNVFIAMNNGEALGYCSISKYWKDENALYLGLLNVRTDHHGKKLGKALVLMAVNRTIELGYPRLDIHTWPGNTKAVPVYKKCGYMWEDRVDSTHLQNFIPTVLSCEVTRDFFKEADWYADSTRAIEVKPDGVKENKFEVFRYSWAKNGHELAAGFERTGRRMRMVETEEYLVSFMAENHELAFGLDYGCAFTVKNKSGQPLHIRVDGRDDQNIRFDYHVERDVTDEALLSARFFVDTITEPQDIWRVHPCVLADVYINGMKAEFGLGIEPKFPLELSFFEERRIPVIGASYRCHVNVASALWQDASVCIKMPQSCQRGACGEQAAVTDFGFTKHTVAVTAQGKATFTTRATTLSYGHEAMRIAYDVTLADGRGFSFERPYHAINRALTGSFAYESESDFSVVNGPFALGISKNSAWGWVHHVNWAPGMPGFPIGRLGKPFEDEFGMQKPIRVEMGEQGGISSLAAHYASTRYPGIEYAELFTLTASGVITRRHRVTNTCDTEYALTLLDETDAMLGPKTYLPYNGGIQTIRDRLAYAADHLNSELIDENWLFDADTRWPRGVYWPAEYKANVRWGDMVFFEHETGVLRKGDVFETKPVVCIHGQFNNFNEFRDYVKNTVNHFAPYATPHLDLTVNGGNPFADVNAWTVKVDKYRDEKLEGDMTVSAASGHAFNATGEMTFSASAPVQPGITNITLDMNLKNLIKQMTKTIFTPARNNIGIHLAETDGVYTAGNGVITFRVAPAFSDAVFSLIKDGHEWLQSKYPSRDPFGWFNPFIGGLNASLQNMNNALIVRERITASFTEQTDSLGNKWTGIASTVAVSEFDEHKGMSYTEHYLTLPGLPILCFFVRLRNDTGAYKSFGTNWQLFVGHPERVDALHVEGMYHDKTKYHIRAGKDSVWHGCDRLQKIGADGLNDALYAYYNTNASGHMNSWVDNRFVSVSGGLHTVVTNGETVTVRPLFLVLTPEILTLESLEDFDKVVFA